ncbi:MAG: hypothetical protein R3C58_10500 [Parvularculaceae bacterium]
MTRTGILTAIITCALLLSGCGFRPLYATAENEAPLSRLVRVENVGGPDTIAPQITDALNARFDAAGVDPRYFLYVSATEGAERLAVQIDATVTRYNYRLAAKYLAVDRQTGARFSGSARAVTAYNIVRSQYSTLFAEKAAVEKAATLLAEEIERDLLIRFSEPPDAASELSEEGFDAELSPSEILIEPRRGEIVEPILDPVTPDDGADDPETPATKD